MRNNNALFASMLKSLYMTKAWFLFLLSFECIVVILLFDGFVYPDFVINVVHVMEGWFPAIKYSSEITFNFSKQMPYIYTAWVIFGACVFFCSFFFVRMDYYENIFSKRLRNKDTPVGSKVFSHIFLVCFILFFFYTMYFYYDGDSISIYREHRSFGVSRFFNDTHLGIFVYTIIVFVLNRMSGLYLGFFRLKFFEFAIEKLRR